MKNATLRKITSVALLALVVTALGCADLSVENPNAPNRSRALATAGDVESLISGGYHTWWNTAGGMYTSATFFLSTTSFQHSAWPANAGAVFYSSFPRPPVANDPANPYYGNMADPYEESYAALSAARSGYMSVNSNEDIASELGPERVTRAKAFAKFIQGLGHATVALLYDQGFVLDETKSDEDVNTGNLQAVGYQELMNAAMGYFDEAISLSEGADFTIPASWMSREVTSDELVKLIHSLKARYMAAVARNPQERASVDWQAVMNEIDAGVDTTFNMQLADIGTYSYEGWETDVINYWTFAGWQQQTYFIVGMADTAGDYQRWLDQDVANRIPNPGEDPVLIRTPDTRFPQGNTLDDQIASPGEYFAVPDPESTAPGAAFALANNFQKPGRGTWRWSYYYDTRPAAHFGPTPWGLVTAAEMRMLKAEAYIRMGQYGQAADLINVSRTAHGLNATDANGANTSCVPKLPDGTCASGDAVGTERALMEMMKWEKRLEAQYRGLLAVPWYFEGRGWGDLYAGTPVQFPLPAQEAAILGIQQYTLGGCGQEGGAAPSVYGWPDQCGGG